MAEVEHHQTHESIESSPVDDRASSRGGSNDVQQFEEEECQPKRSKLRVFAIMVALNVCPSICSTFPVC